MYFLSYFSFHSTKSSLHLLEQPEHSSHTQLFLIELLSDDLLIVGVFGSPPAGVEQTLKRVIGLWGHF